MLAPALSFARSEKLFARAQEIVAGGTTQGKAPNTLIPGEYPIYAARGRGATLWDVDGNQFLDWILAYGIIVAFIQKPELIGELSNLSIRFRLPELTFGRISWKELLSGFVILGLPQAPLTLGNAIIGTVAENNQYFPDRKVTAKTISLDHGVMNLISTCIGGVPMCHGAGGMAGHIRFGARTGGALVILGLIVLLTGLFLSDSVALLFQVFPRPILGVILFFAGVELALVVKDVKLKKQNLFVLLVTAGTAMWNMGVAYLAGLILYYGLQRRWFKV